MATHSHNSQSSSSLTFSKKPRPVRRDDCLVQDCQNLAKLDYESPFRDIFDAVDRLLPFHILYSEPSFKTENASSKRKTFEASLDQRSREFQTRSEKVRTRLESFEESFAKVKRRRPEEEYRLEKLVSQSVREQYVNDKFKFRNNTIGGNSIRTMEPLSTIRKLPTSLPIASANQDRLPPPPTSRLESKLHFPSLEYSQSEFIKRH